MKRRSLLLAASVLLLTAACESDAGSVRRVRFKVSARGSDPGELQTPAGWQVRLAAAELSVAAVYFRNAKNDGGTAEAQGRIVAQVLGPFTIDALDPAPQALEVDASAVTERARSAELWLTEAQTGPVADALGPFTALAHIAGVAQRGDSSIAFDGGLQFPEASGDTQGYQTWSNRRIRRIDCDFTPKSGGELEIRVDPRHFVDAVSFDTLSEGDGARSFVTSAEQLQLRNGIALTGAYGFELAPP